MSLPEATRLPRVDVQEESEAPRGWSYHVVLEYETGRVSEHTVSLNWVDHDYWSGGKLPPSMVVRQVLEYLLARMDASGFPASFDAARARRWFPAIDTDIRIQG
ncbi:MAG: hypothetical protein SFZ23_10345 [Planctomycetota bacterium]|nr:hypothetical protein [Planctomycetota bacterium]